MSTKMRYVKVSTKQDKIETVNKKVYILDWKLINSDVLDKELEAFGPGYYAVVAETNTTYYLQTRIG